MSPESKPTPAASPVDMLMVISPAAAPAPAPVVIPAVFAIVKTPAVLAVRSPSTTLALELLAVAVKKLRKAMLLFNKILRPASSVSPKFPALPDASKPSVRVMSLLAWNVTFAVLSITTTALAWKATSVAVASAKVSAVCISAVVSKSALVVTMSILRGSSNNVPAVPSAALRSTVPRNTKLSLPDTSANPPSPDWAPPRALIEP